MPQYAAFGCNNRGDEEGVSLHRFPLRKPALLKQWLHHLGREGFKPVGTSRLCSKHFLQHCFKLKADPYAKYGIHSPKTRRLLLDDAVPTEFGHRQSSGQQQQRLSSVERIERREHQAKVAKLLSVSQEMENLPSVQTREHTRDVDPEIKSPRIMRRRKKVKPALQQSTSTEPRPHKSPKKLISLLPVRKKTSATVTRSMLEESQSLSEPFTEPILPLSPVFEESLHSSASQEVIIQPEEQPAFRIPLPSPRPRRHLQMTAVHYGTPRRTKKDHAYATKNARTCGTQTVSPESTDDVEVEKTQSYSPVMSSPFRSESSPERTDVEELAEYLPSSDTCTSETDESSGSDKTISKQDPTQIRKFIVFEDSLTVLMKFCKDCGSPVVSSTCFTRGSMVGYKISCHKGHSYVWHSQPIENKQPLGNLLIVASTLLTGGTYSRLSAFADTLKLQLFSKTVFNKIQKLTILPVIQEAWNTEVDSVVTELKLQNHVVLAGDGRCDSPGHNAKYGSYTLMHTNGDGQQGSRKIVSMKLVQVSEVKNSCHMEPEGLDRCLKEVLDRELDVGVLATDQHNMIVSNMKKNYKEIDHQFDVWHVAKGVIKKLSNAAKVKGCEELSPWIQSVSNHLWWCCDTCGQDELVLREKWMSILHHITNKHQWSGNRKVHKCSHPQLTSAEKKKLCWLKPASPAFLAFKKIVMNTRLLKALSNLTKFCHTGELEVFHSMLLKYCPKRQHFHYNAMYARLMLAAMEWNHSRRERKFDKSGKPATSVVFSKRRKVFVLRNRYEKVESTHIPELMKRIHTVHKDNVQIPVFCRPPDLAKNIARIDKPQKEDLERQFRSRFK